MFRIIALTGLAAMLAAATLSLTPEARAQIGNIFSDQPPRPPGSVPRGGQAQQPPVDDDEEVPELPQGGRVLPAPNRPYQGSALPGPVQSQPLAPPPGTTVVPQNAPVAVAPPDARPGTAAPGQPLPKNVPQTPASLQPG